MGSVVHFTADDTVIEVAIVEVGGVDVLGVDEENPQPARSSRCCR
jgi:hypothetical protein